jgi:hypothetical protein
MLPEDNRRGDFFEADEYQAVLDNLPEYLRLVIQPGSRILRGP